MAVISYLFDGVDDNLKVASAPATAAPVTIACWGKSTSQTAAQALACLGLDGGLNHRFLLYLAGTVGGDPVRAQTRDATPSEASTTTAYVANSWEHYCGVFAAANDRRAFRNGGSKGTEATTRTPTGINAFIVGGALTTGAFFAGRIGHVAIWNLALSDAEVASLAAGANPVTIQPANLVDYWPLRDDANDVVGTRHLTVTGATLDTDNPPVAQTKTLTPATTVVSAQVLVRGGGAIQKTLTSATTVAQAQPLTVTKPLRKTVDPAIEFDSARAIVTGPTNKTLTPAVTSLAAQPLSYIKPIRKTLAAAVEIDQAVALSPTLSSNIPVGRVEGSSSLTGLVESGTGLTGIVE